MTLTAGLALAVAALSGCGAPKPPGQATSGTNTGAGATTGTGGAATSTLTIISPHPKDIQVEFERGFKAKHPNATLKWLDYGGTTEDLNYVLTTFKGKSADQGIKVDVFFGGGAEPFEDMAKKGLLSPLSSDYKVPARLNGVPLLGQKNTWVAAALSGFGILFNKTIAGRDRLPIPATWADLGNPALRDRVALADPRNSGTAHQTYEIILQANGWQRGWQTLTALAGNARSFGKSSSKLLQDVTSGEAAMSPAIDFYAATAIARAGEQKLGYIEPQGQRVITPDPIAVLRGAPNAKLAQDFVAYVMSPEGQKLWMLKKGAPGGPQNNALYRVAALPSLYKPIPPDSLIESDPYTGKNDFKFDPDKSALRRRVLQDLMGAILIDNQRLVKARWKQTPDAAKITFMPLSEDDVAKLAPRWDDATFRNTKISEWKQASRAHFTS